MTPRRCGSATTRPRTVSCSKSAGIPTPRTLIAFDVESALRACELVGYPAVLKPVTGSWGRLLARVNGPEQARLILEQKKELGSFHHAIFYVQEYVEKPDRDIRAYVVGDRVLAASYRTAKHWVTNAARGAESVPCPITPEIEDLALRACAAVGARLAGVDLIETHDGLAVIEVNTGGEFKGLMSTTDVDIAGAIVDEAVRMVARGSNHDIDRSTARALRNHADDRSPGRRRPPLPRARRRKTAPRRARARGVEIVRFDDREFLLDLAAPDPAMMRCHVVLERCINHLRALYTLRVLNDWGVPTVNTYEVANICGDKLLTSTALERAGVPSPRTLIAFTPESALAACEEIGYPMVMKPAVGSWGRLLARVNDRDAAEALLEHKVTLGSFHHGAFYIQEFVRKPGRDIRTFVVGDETICAIYRDSPHWITNTARGASASNCPVTDELMSSLRRPRKRSVAASWPSISSRATAVCSSTRSTTQWSSATASIPPASIFRLASSTTSSPLVRQNGTVANPSWSLTSPRSKSNVRDGWFTEHQTRFRLPGRGIRSAPQGSSRCGRGTDRERPRRF